MKKLSLILLLLLIVCVGCQWGLRSNDDQGKTDAVVIERLDRMELLYLTTGDFAALQQMKTMYPAETRILIEEVLQLGMVDEPDINTRFLLFFQDSTLQSLMRDVELQYADVEDVTEGLTNAFSNLSELLPDMIVPRVYMQIGSLDQSVVVDDTLVGVSLDKYLGADNPVYQRYGYSERQRSMMTRQYIVPDCVAFYLLRHYPMPIEGDDTTHLKRTHMARIQYVVNQVTDSRVFSNDEVSEVEKYMTSHPEVSIKQLLSAKNNQ